MKTIKHLILLLLLLAYFHGFTQRDSLHVTGLKPKLTIEPAIGIHTNFGTDFLVTNLVQWNVQRHLTLSSHTSLNLNNPFIRDFNYVKTDYNYSLNQKFGIGTTFYAKRSSHTLMAMVGVKYTTFKETLHNPDFNEVTVSISAMSPDYGLMYSFKKGWKKYFFTTRVYLPLCPWPGESFDTSYAEGNMNNIALEVGVGIKLK
jgi:hypothetical protein